MLATLWVDHGIYIPYVSMRLQDDLCFLLRPFSKLQPAPVSYKAETPFQPDFDNSALRKHVHFQKIRKKTTSNWYNQTSYKAAFDLPYLNTSNACRFSCWKGHRRWTREVCCAVNKLVLNCREKKMKSSHFFQKRAATCPPKSYPLSTTNTQVSQVPL